MSTAAGHVVTGHHAGSAHPLVVARSSAQRAELVRMLLQDPYAGRYPRVHAKAEFYVHGQSEDPASGSWPKRWLRVGFHNGYAAVYCADETRPLESDWAWIALRRQSTADAPLVYFDQDSEIAFPQEAVMPLGDIEPIVLNWCASGTRPTSVDWLTINELTWHFTPSGNILSGAQQRSA